MNGIGARLRREIDHAAIEPPELGRRAVALDLELLDGVDDRIVRELPGSGWSTEMPSKRYSFVRGLPPLMRGRTEFGGRATPGAMAASMMNRRPFSGSRTTCSFSTTVPRLAVSTRTTGGSATTVTCS